MSRPHKLTPELADALVAARQGGHSITGAAAACGIHRATLHRWLQEGEADNAAPELQDLADRFNAAGATTIGNLINAAYRDAVGGVEIESGTRGDGTEYTKVTPPNGKVALEMLARMAPEDWRPVKAVEVSGPNGGAVAIGGDLQALAARISKVRADHEAGG